MNGSAMVRWTVRVLGVALVLALALLLVVRIYGSRRLSTAKRIFAASVGAVAESGDPCASRRAPGEEDAGVFVQAGTEAMIFLGEDIPLVGEMSSTPPQNWTESQRANLRHIVARNAPALELLHRAVGLKRSSVGIADAAAKMEKPGAFPLGLKFIRVQRLLSDDALLALQERDFPRVVSSAEVMSAMAAGLEQEPLLIAELLGFACEKMFLQVAADAVATPALDARSLAALQRQLIEVDLGRAWRRTLACEFQVSPLAKGAEGPGVPETGAQKLRYALFADYLDAALVERMAFLAGAIDRPYGNGLSELASAASRSSLTGIAMQTRNLINAIGRCQVVLSERRLARVALALRRHALETGGYPTSLASFPEAVERDPFTGGQIVFTPRPDGSAQLTVPDGVKVWDRLNPEFHNPGPFSWELPAPTPAAPLAEVGP